MNPVVNEVSVMSGFGRARPCSAVFDRVRPWSCQPLKWNLSELEIKGLTPVPDPGSYSPRFETWCRGCSQNNIKKTIKNSVNHGRNKRCL